ncbi:MAG TPA: ABC transporter permease subunit [Bacillota bacterium]|nr:ABC transporter permease subunit [Bacillota bacterium]
MALGITALLVLIVYPLAAVVIQAEFPHLFAPQSPNARFDPAALIRVFRTPTDYRMLGDSVALSLGAAVFASVAGGALAVVLGRTDLPGRAVFAGLAWVNLLIPSFLLAEGWTFLLQQGGLLSHFLTEPGWMQNVFTTPWGVGAILALKFYPFAYLTVSAALPWLGGEHEAVARTLGASTTAVWRRVFIPLLLPFLASAATIVFADVLSDFGVAITVAESHQFPLLTYGIYSSLYNQPTDYAGAGALALLLGVAVATALLAQLLILRKNRFATIHAGFRPPAPARLRPQVRYPLLLAVILFFAVALGAPAGSILVESFLKGSAYGIITVQPTLANFASLAGPTAHTAVLSLGYSLRLALVTATAALALGTLLAYFGTQGKGGTGQFLQAISLWTISVPGIILAAGYVFAWNQRWLSSIGLELYGTVFALGLCYLAGGLPYVLRFQMGALSQLDRRMMSAARVQGAGVGAVLTRIVTPILAEGAVSLWLFVLAGTTFELPASEFLYPPGQPTLAVEINHFFSESSYGQGMALAIATAAVLITAVLILRLLMRRRLPAAVRAQAPARTF